MFYRMPFQRKACVALQASQRRDSVNPLTASISEAQEHPASRLDYADLPCQRHPGQPRSFGAGKPGGVTGAGERQERAQGIGRHDRRAESRGVVASAGDLIGMEWAARSHRTAGTLHCIVHER